MTRSSYTSGEVAKVLGIPSRTVRRYLQLGKIPAIQNPLTRRWRVRHVDLRDFMENHDSSLGDLANPGE